MSTPISHTSHLDIDVYRQLKEAKHDTFSLGPDGNKRSITFMEEGLKPKEILENTTISFSHSKNDGYPEHLSIRVGKKTPLYRDIELIKNQVSNENEQESAVKALLLKYIATLLDTHESAQSGLPKIAAHFQDGECKNIHGAEGEVLDKEAIKFTNYGKTNKRGETERTALRHFSILADQAKSIKTINKSLVTEHVVKPVVDGDGSESGGGPPPPSPRSPRSPVSGGDGGHTVDTPPASPRSPRSPVSGGDGDHTGDTPPTLPRSPRPHGAGGDGDHTGGTPPASPRSPRPHHRVDNEELVTLTVRNPPRSGGGSLPPLYGQLSSRLNTVEQVLTPFREEELDGSEVSIATVPNQNEIVTITAQKSLLDQIGNELGDLHPVDADVAQQAKKDELLKIRLELLAELDKILSELD